MFASATLWNVAAQQGGTTRYVYDDRGRLIAVISPTGEANIYEYDAAGNFTAVRRLTTNDLAVFAFSPRIGVPGDQVTFLGVGFGAGVNSVSFNGVPANIVQVTLSTIVAEVPQGATTGPATITTGRGSVTTTKPFTVAGIHVTPPVVSGLLSGSTVQFSATVVLEDDPSLIWSVNGADGGSSSAGSITGSGLYTAPDLPVNQPAATFTVRATSVALPNVFGEAQVNVVNPQFVWVGRSAGVSVLFGGVRTPISSGGISVQKASASVSALSNAVSIAKSSPVTDTISPAVSVSKDSPTIPTISSAVAVSKGSPTVPTSSAGVAVSKDSATLTADSPSVSVSKGSATTPAISPSVSTTTGPNITSIVPGQLSRGSATSISISGQNLTGATGLIFLNANGTPDSGITASGISVSADGSSITVLITVNSGSALGTRILIVSTPKGKSFAIDVSTNTFEVIQ